MDKLSPRMALMNYGDFVYEYYDLLWQRSDDENENKENISFMIGKNEFETARQLASTTCNILRNNGFPW